MLMPKRIPGFSRYGITRCGTIFNLETGKQLKTTPDVRGYHQTTLVNDQGEREGVKRHRLVALTYLEKPHEIVEDLVVNHKDTIPGNDWESNLEWCTQKQNVQHWSENGIKRQRIPLETLDGEDGRLVRYNTVAECSKDLGIDRHSIYVRLQRGPEHVWPEGKRYRKGHSDDPWPLVEPLKYGRSRDVILKDLVSGISFIYEKLSDVLPFIGYKLPAVWGWANNLNQPVIPGLYQIQFFDEVKPWREVEDVFKELQDHTHAKVVFTFDSEWNNAIWYESASACAEDNGLRPTALNYRLKSQGKTVFRDSKRYCYYDDLPDVQKKTIRYEVPPQGGYVQRPSKATPFPRVNDTRIKSGGCL